MTLDEQEIQKEAERDKLIGIMWVALTYILTAAGAGLLAEMGYLHLSTPIAIIDGIIVATVYVGFRVIAKRRE
ncbi:MAG: hypothetical protein RTU92_14650 [Candidatus Thorarchaeota archaeon]